MAPSLHHSFFLFLVILIIVFTSTATSANKDIVKTTCTNISASNPNIHLDFCTSTLTKPTSKSCNLKDLALLSVKVASCNATNTITYINEQLTSSPNGKQVEGPLDDCLELYSDALGQLKKSSKAIRKGRLNDANVWVTSVMDAATTCDDGFEETEVVNPLEKNNHDLFEIGAIILAIISLLRG